MRSKISTGELKVTSKMTNALTTADIAITETSRDQPNAPPDRQALMMVKPYQGMVAWPTAILALGIAGSFAVVCTLGTLGITADQGPRGSQWRRMRPDPPFPSPFAVPASAAPAYL